MLIEDKSKFVGERISPQVGRQFTLRRETTACTIPTLAKLNARHITFHYGEKLALDDVSVPLYSNRVTAFIGPSGCGKSTLIRVFNRMHDFYPDQHVKGEVLLDG